MSKTRPPARKPKRPATGRTRPHKTGVTPLPVDAGMLDVAGVPTVAEVESVANALPPGQRAELVELLLDLSRLLGTHAAARAWLNSRDAGFDPTPLDAIRAGRVSAVRDAVRSQVSSSPTYA